MLIRRCDVADAKRRQPSVEIDFTRVSVGIFNLGKILKYFDIMPTCAYVTHMRGSASWDVCIMFECTVFSSYSIFLVKVSFLFRKIVCLYLSVHGNVHTNAHLQPYPLFVYVFI